LIFQVHEYIQNRRLTSFYLPSTSLLVLDLVDKRSNVRKQLDSKFISGLDEFLGVLGGAYARRGAGQDDGASGQGGTLAEEAD